MTTDGLCCASKNARTTHSIGRSPPDNWRNYGLVKILSLYNNASGKIAIECLVPDSRVQARCQTQPRVPHVLGSNANHSRSAKFSRDTISVARLSELSCPRYHIAVSALQTTHGPLAPGDACSSRVTTLQTIVEASNDPRKQSATKRRIYSRDDSGEAAHTWRIIRGTRLRDEYTVHCPRTRVVSQRFVAVGIDGNFRLVAAIIWED